MPRPTRGIAYVVIAATAWGTGGAAASALYRTSGLGPIAVSFWRNVAGAALLATVIAAMRRPLGRLRPGPLITTGIGLAVYQTAYFASVRYAGLAVATIITLASGPVLMAIGDRILFGDRLGRRGTITIGIALVGLVLLVGGGSSTPGGRPALGIAYAFLSAFGYAGVTLLSRYLERHDRAADPYTTALAGFVVGIACLGPLAILEGILPTSGSSWQTLGLVGYLGAVPSALAYALFFAGLATVSATTASVIGLVEPVTATIIAVLLLGEHLTAVTAIGALVLLAAVAAHARSSP